MENSQETVLKALTTIYGLTNKRKCTLPLPKTIGEKFNINAAFSWFIPKYLLDHNLLIELDGSTRIKKILIWNEEKSEPTERMALAITEAYKQYNKDRLIRKKEGNYVPRLKRVKPSNEEKNADNPPDKVKKETATEPTFNTEDFKNVKRNFIAKSLGDGTIELEYKIRVANGTIKPFIREIEVIKYKDNPLENSEITNSIDDDTIFDVVMRAEDSMLVDVLRDRGWDVKISKTVTL